MNRVRNGLILSVAAVGCLSLVACRGSDSNKLLTMPKSQAAKFIYESQNYASKQTRLYDATGSVYLKCVVDPSHFNNPFDKSAKNPCQGFLKTMVTFANRTSVFKGLTLSDINNKKVAQRLKSEVMGYEMTGGKTDTVRS